MPVVDRRPPQPAPRPATTVPDLAPLPAPSVTPSPPGASLDAPLAPLDVTGLPAAGGAVAGGGALRLRAGHLAGVDASLAKAVDAARAAVDARVAAGVDPSYPLGDVSALLPLAGSFGVRASGGSNHAFGSLVVVNPGVSGLAAEPGSPTPVARAHHVKHGFAEYVQRAAPELGGRSVLDALGPPLEEEHTVGDNHSVQRFAHGALHWAAGRGVWHEPADLLATRAPAVAALPAPPRTDVPVDAALRDLAKDLGHALAHTKKAALHKRDLELIACDATLPARLRDACASLAGDAATMGAFEALGGINRRSLATNAMATWLVPLSFHGEDHGAYFLHWAQKQLTANPVIGAVHAEVRALLEGPHKPARMNALYEAVRALAAKHLAGDARLSGADKEHVVNVTTLVAMAALSLKNDHSAAIAGFPPYLWDGRSKDAAWDKAWHFGNHAMMAYVALYDARFGDGVVRTEMARAVEDTDKDGVAQRVARTYDERKGALGSYVGQALGGVPDEEDLGALVYAPRPADLSDEEGRVYDLAVRIGDAHEYKSSGDTFTITVDDVGDTSKRFDPTAMIASRWGRVWGLQDEGVARDLTANRLGARFAVEWFRDPAAPPLIPHDDGKTAATAAYASVASGGKAIPFDHYVAHERTLVAVMQGDVTQEQAAALYDKHLAGARALGKEAAHKLLLDEVGALVDELVRDGKHDQLAHYYGSFAARHLRWGERLTGFAVDDGYMNPEPTAHRDWAKWSLANGKAADVAHGFTSRIAQTFAST